MLKKQRHKQAFIKKWFGLLLILFCAAPALAQNFTLGVKAGPLVSWPAFGDREAKDQFGRRIKVGFHVGGIIGFPLKNRYSLMLEGGFSQRSRTTSYNDGDRTTTFTMPMADMSMWLRKSFRFMLWRNVPADGFINIGPEINYWFSPRASHAYRDNATKLDVVTYPTDGVFEGISKIYLRNMNHWLFGIGLGTGLRAPITRTHHVSGEIRFISGHTFLGDKDSATIQTMIDYQDTFKVNLKTVAFNVAYTVDIDVRKSRTGKSTIKKKLKR